VIFSGFLANLNYIRHYEYDFISYPGIVKVKKKQINISQHLKTSSRGFTRRELTLQLIKWCR